MHLCTFGALPHSQMLSFHLPLQPKPDEPEECGLLSFADSLKSSPLRSITIHGHLDDMLFPILRGFAANTNTVDRTLASTDTDMYNAQCEWVQIRHTVCGQQPTTFASKSTTFISYVFQRCTSPNCPVDAVGHHPMLLHLALYVLYSSCVMVILCD